MRKKHKPETQNQGGKMTGRFKPIITIFLLAALAMVPAGTSAQAAKSTSKSYTRRDPSKYQSWLENRVRHELVMLPFYSVFDNLAFKVQGDQVILLGQVVHPTLRSDAEAVVKKIEGVRSVVNQIEVLPASPFDDRLRRAVYRAIYSDTTLQRYALPPVPSIHIIVKNGHVTLEGVTANEMDRNIANIRANGVPGVFSVTNNLQIEKRG